MLGKLEAFSKVIGAVLMPLMLFYLGHLYTERDKERAAQERQLAAEREAQQAELQIADRGRDLLLSIGGYITSDDPRKQLYGIALLEDMRGSRELPEALVQLVQNLGSPTIPPLAMAEESVTERAAPLRAEVRYAADRVLEGILAPRLYVHIASEDQRAAARAVERVVAGRAIDGAAIVVPGIQRVESTPSTTELRFFKKEEQAMAEAIARIVDEAVATPIAVRDLSARYGASTAIRPNHFELWFAPGPIRLAGSGVASS